VSLQQQSMLRLMPNSILIDLIIQDDLAPVAVIVQLIQIESKSI
jgi:hypothetical protein